MKNYYVLGLAVLLLILAANSLFVVRETERAVMLRFGELVNADISPGLHVKIPWVNQVRKFDARIQIEDSVPADFFTLEQKALVVDSYAKWRIVDVGQFYVSTQGEVSRAGTLLAQRVNDGLRDQIGERTLQEVVAGERDQLMLDLTANLNMDSAVDIGIEVIDVRVKRIDLPEDVRDSVYERMITERNREAQELRSRGDELAIGIRADADRQAIIFEAEAYRDAENIRGEGDARATAVYADAYNKDPEFYAFTRSLNAYRETFKNKGDVLLLDPDSRRLAPTSTVCALCALYVLCVEFSRLLPRQQRVNLVAIRRAARGAGLGYAERCRGIGEAHRLFQRRAFRQRHRQPGIKSIARASRIHHIHKKTVHKRCIRVAHDLRASRAQGNHRCLVVAG